MLSAGSLEDALSWQATAEQVGNIPTILADGISVDFQRLEFPLTSIREDIIQRFSNIELKSKPIL